MERRIKGYWFQHKIKELVERILYGDVINGVVIVGELQIIAITSACGDKESCLQRNRTCIVFFSLWNIGTVIISHSSL